jgi:hypothetical protein
LIKNVAKEALKYQHNYFQILDEAFLRITGCGVNEFSNFDDFPIAVHKLGTSRISEVEKGYQWAQDNIGKFYEDNAKRGFKLASEISGFKLNLGGSSAFLETHLLAVKRTLLYADCTLIPDPIFPFFESDRPDDAFFFPNLLRAIFSILHLRPYVNESLLSPAFFVFPSWEKMLEINDIETNKELIQLNLDFYNYHLNLSVESMDDLFKYAKLHSRKFLAQVQQKALFIPPESQIESPITQSFKIYDNYVREWRSQTWINHYEKFSKPEIVINAIGERLLPQYHIIENSFELNSHPLLPVFQQGHYFRLISNMNSARLENIGFLNNPTNTLLRALSDKSFTWFSGITSEVIVELRNEGYNSKFRKQLLEVVDQIQGSSFDKTDQAVRDLNQHIEMMHSEHVMETKIIYKKFQKKHKETLTLGLLAFGASLVPALAPLLGAMAPISLLTKYGTDKREQIGSQKLMSKSLIGIISEARINST